MSVMVVRIGPDATAGSIFNALRITGTVPAREAEPRRGVAQYAGFSLHAGIGVEADQRAKLERLARFVSRPSVSIERLALTARGQVRYRLKTPYRDGTTHIVLEPVDFMASSTYAADISYYLGKNKEEAAPLRPAAPSAFHEETPITT